MPKAVCYTEAAVQLADFRHRIDDRTALVRALMNPFKVLPTPVSCGELLARLAPRLATSGLWI
jgi:hypothetical protein